MDMIYVVTAVVMLLVRRNEEMQSPHVFKPIVSRRHSKKTALPTTDQRKYENVGRGLLTEASQLGSILTCLHVPRPLQVSCHQPRDPRDAGRLPTNCHPSWALSSHSSEALGAGK